MKRNWMWDLFTANLKCGTLFVCIYFVLKEEIMWIFMSFYISNCLLVNHWSLLSFLQVLLDFLRQINDDKGYVCVCLCVYIYLFIYNVYFLLELAEPFIINVYLLYFLYRASTWIVSYTLFILLWIIFYFRPMEEQRQRYGPALYSLTKLVLSIRLFLLLSLGHFESRKLWDNFQPLIFFSIPIVYQKFLGAL